MMLNKKKILAQHDSDAALVKVLRAHADDEHAIHAVEHHFFARERAELEAVADLGARLGFEPGPIQEQSKAGKRRFFFDLVSRTPTELPKLSRDALLMLAFGSAFEVTYDGWGTGIVPKPAPASSKTPKKKARAAKR